MAWSSPCRPADRGVFSCIDRPSGKKYSGDRSVGKPQDECAESPKSAQKEGERGIRKGRENEIGRIIVDAAIILTHGRLAQMKLGLLLNFGAAVRKEGSTRTVNGFPESR